MNRWIAATMTMLLGMGAAQAATVKYDYDESVDFASWKTMAWKETREVKLDKITQERIEKAITDGFAAKGYTLTATPAEADFVVGYRAAARRDLRIRDGFRGPGFGREISVDSVPVGVLLVEVYDAETGEIAWRGFVSDAISSNPAKADKKTAKAVEKLLKRFPPESKSN